MAKHFLCKCSGGKKVENIEVQLIEKEQASNFDFEVSYSIERKVLASSMF